MLHFAGSMFHRTKDIDEDLPYKNGDMEQHRRDEEDIGNEIIVMSALLVPIP